MWFETESTVAAAAAADTLSSVKIVRLKPLKKHNNEPGYLNNQHFFGLPCPNMLLHVNDIYIIITSYLVFF